MDVLIGSTFPLSLIRRKVQIEPSSLSELSALAARAVVHSFWGHSNTYAAASAMLGFNVAPRKERPAISLDEDKLPALDGISFRDCWILSPDYVSGFRPEIGAEVSPGKIANWQVLRIRWL